jgi:hypothetical protein
LRREKKPMLESCQFEMAIVKGWLIRHGSGV